VPTEPTSELATEPATTIPLSLLTLVQVLVMGDEEVRVWGSLSDSLSMCLSDSLSESLSDGLSDGLSECV
jgi:hypothetical protein